VVTSTATLTRHRKAIRTRRQVRFMANGKEREFSPHVLGTKYGSWHVFGWQSGGGSGSHLKAGGDWRCFALEKVSALRVVD
jgi:predicted DNA-binding transcriptional regulator YafY